MKIRKRNPKFHQSLAFFFQARMYTGAVAENPKDLLERALDDNDQEAWEELIKQGYKVVRRVLVQYSLRDMDYEDATHTIFLRIRPHLERLKIRSRPAFLSYVKIAAQNLRIDEFRARSRWIFVSSFTTSEDREGLPLLDSLPDEHPASDPEETTSDRELLERLRKCKEELSGENRKIVDLYYEEEVSYQLIGKMVGLTTSAVWKRLARIVAQLRECIEEHGKADERKQIAD